MNMFDDEDRFSTVWGPWQCLKQKKQLSKLSHTKKPMTDKVKVGFGMDTPLSKNREVPAVASVT